MCASMAVAADDQAPRETKAEFRSDDMDDALTRLVDIEHLDIGSGCFNSQPRQQFPSYLAGAGTPVRRRNSMVRRRESQFRIMNRQTTALEIE